jgi:hypothetical protein
VLPSWSSRRGQSRTARRLRPVCPDNGPRNFGRQCWLRPMLWLAPALLCTSAQQLQHALLRRVGQRRRGHRGRLADRQRLAVARSLVGVGSVRFDAPVCNTSIRFLLWRARNNSDALRKAEAQGLCDVLPEKWRNWLFPQLQDRLPSQLESPNSWHDETALQAASEITADRGRSKNQDAVTVCTVLLAHRRPHACR